MVKNALRPSAGPRAGFLPDCCKIKITTPQFRLIYYVNDAKRLLTILSVAAREDVYEEPRIRLYSTKTDRSTGVICGQVIRLNGLCVSKDYPEHLWRIRYKDPESGKTLVFLTNNTTLPPLTIAALYKSRRQVEQLFKWIKQHLRIKLLGSKREHGEDANLSHRAHLRADCPR